MNDFALIAKIAYYLLFVFSIYFYARHKQKCSKGKKFGLVATVIFAILFGIYGVICGPPGESIGDRRNYAMRFENPAYEEIVKANSFGLYVIESVLHLFTNNASVLFFVVSVLYFCINIYCYKRNEEQTPLFLLMFFLSTLGLFGFYALKQAMALAFANLAWTKYFQKKKIWTALSIVLAISFHEAAWMMIPFLVLARYCNGSKVKQLFVYIAMIAIAVLFPHISAAFVSLFSYIPGMSDQIGGYLDDSNSIMIDLNFFTIMKGAPFYIITIVALAGREYFREKIKDYDLLLALSVFCSIFSLLSLYMYWMFRFALFCYVPVFILASQMCKNMQVKNRKIFTVAILAMLLGLMVKILIQYYFIYGGVI